MIFILSKVKNYLSLKRQIEVADTEYTDLAPIDEITNGDEYLNALNWALNNKRVKNIAMAGPYGAGKSSIIETYLKKHPNVREKSLRISMATFVENATNEDGVPQKVDIRQDEIEMGILKQLFYKVDYKKIPQSRYRKLHKIGWKHIWGYLIGLAIMILLMEYIFFPEIFYSFIAKICTAGSSIKLPPITSLIMFGILALVILAIIAVMYRSILSHFKVREIKLPADTTVKSEDDSSETVFNKNMDEIVYFFEETKYRFVFFEDLDRLENSSIFVHLRELNTLLNNYDVIKEPIIFIYAVKDNIFSDTDRTKFFDFIIPVIPVINSTNSGEILLEKLKNSSEIGIIHGISQSFVLDISPYVSDMRILQNIYNEFVVYKNTLRMGQDLNLSDEPMMALMIFKNLYPRDFADIQYEKGIIKQAFIDKQNCMSVKREEIQYKIGESIEVLNKIQSESLKSIKELKSALLCEITGWSGIARQFSINRGSTCYAREIILNDYDMSAWKSASYCSGSYNDWNGNGGYSFSCNNFSEICAAYFEREKRIKLIEENRIAEEQEKIEQLRIQTHKISGWSLKQLIEQFGAEEVLSEEVRKNKLLVFLLRRGYIDEKYVNYINYFKGNSITKDDMNFILSVKNLEPKTFNYSLTKTSMIVQRLQVYEFEYKAIYNFDLLEWLLSSNDSKEKLNTYIRQLADGDEQSWKFIDEFVDITKFQSYFIKLLASAWSNMWKSITENTALTYERKIYYLSLLISNAGIEAIVAMNIDNEINEFIEQHEDILQQLSSVANENVITLINDLHIMFSKIFIENVSEEILNYIFDNNCYIINEFMIQYVVEFKNRAFVSDLKLKNYTTIINLGFTPLIEYVRENLPHYIDTIVLAEEHSYDTEDNIIDLLERSIDDIERCIGIIEHEEFCMEDITNCCGQLIPEKKTAVKNIWDTLLRNNKILSTWENVSRYWIVFKFTQEIMDYIEDHRDRLAVADSQCVDDDFIRGFINTEITDETFRILLPCIRTNSFDIALGSISKSKVSIMIDCQYFNFTAERYEEIKESYPDLCVKFILQYQDDYVAQINAIQMDSNLLESLLFSNSLKKEIAQTILKDFGAEYMSVRIAENLRTMRLSISLEIFNAAWKHLDEFGKQKLMLEYLNLLDSDSIYSCFDGLKRWYSDFLDRSKQHIVELDDIPENKKLAEHLKSLGYITSYQSKEKKEYDAATDSEKVKTVILCRVKAIK